MEFSLREPASFARQPGASEQSAQQASRQTGILFKRRNPFCFIEDATEL